MNISQLCSPLKLWENRAQELYNTLIRTTHFEMRTGKDIHTLCWGDVSLGVDFETGEKLITFDTERQTKTRSVENPKDKR
ncbi:hypothetical protein DPMN_044848 [Dreissena polymorpha]|uniref:Uncharacterized protein n=1 Tax=Dreissena polymorpha TaxID=45954 RepID=A0A9D4HWT3_DREPO|nr:hypothetical protein DPMN_044848 [Dreissena polymorpha]